MRRIDHSTGEEIYPAFATSMLIQLICMRQGKTKMSGLILVTQKRFCSSRLGRVVAVAMDSLIFYTELGALKARLVC